MEKVYMIAAGGTGGHFYPGYALGMKLIERGHDVVFIIKTGNQSAAKILKDNEIFYHEIDCEAMPRSINPIKWFSFIKKFIKSYSYIRELIKSYKPLVCVGMGGYISFPLILCAHFMGVKTAVHDSNSRLGFANKISKIFVDKVMLGLPLDKPIKNSVLVGTPIRKEFAQGLSQVEEGYWELTSDFAINILIFGGSQGARHLNLAASEMVLRMIKRTARINFFHVSGRRDYEMLKEIYKDSPQVDLIEYAYDICALMRTSQIIIARSGASSIAEIVSLQKPSILVPLPTAADNHQYFNAKILEDNGCALLVEDNKDLSANLEKALCSLLGDPKLLGSIQDNLRISPIPDPLEAADLCATQVERLAIK
ncbi:MAG: UDP-N-acetylglucosamine--N-acetylmuramyl-(pentapeptide) pyrophosphoryl-undecaprenol N-acetylglucosamine transferase [Elusimicrobiaceae bacterium]|nr:UDP-N-acetylglucosamine--N-acetylmuramyl-(pentapeptide) pyrophosphoryl-undecaprenol N-acetylglucosamine transferase [Elusimicrobiaceae bacterium]